MTCHRTTYFAVLIIVFIGLSGMAQETEYKPYKAGATKVLLFELHFDKDRLSIHLGDSTGSKVAYAGNKDQLRIAGDKVSLNGAPMFDQLGLVIGDEHIPYDAITDLSITRDTAGTSVRVLTRETDKRRVQRIHDGNIVTPFESRQVGEGDFVRGMIFSVTGDIEVNGEVNKDIVSLFGHVHIAETAVARGDILSVTGKVKVKSGASVYGKLYSEQSGYDGRDYRGTRRRHHFELGHKQRYDRVDGLALQARLEYDDQDSVLPQVEITAGYALESQRIRYRFSARQAIIGRNKLVLAVSAYQELASEDDWIISGNEASVLAVLAAEDFRDYYESRGGEASLRYRPINDLQIELGYSYNRTGWLAAEPDLWHLFGGDNKFEQNFSSVPDSIRAAGIAEINDADLAALRLGFSFDQRNMDHPFDSSAWAVSAAWEYSHPDLSSDFSYRRYQATIHRYQKLHRRLALLSRFIIGGSSGYLPMHRRYYLGGLGTLRGFEDKEFNGDSFWLGNIESRYDYKWFDLATSLFVDAGQTSYHDLFSGNGKVHTSIGLALYVGSDLRVSLSRKLDTGHPDSRLLVRLKHRF